MRPNQGARSGPNWPSRLVILGIVAALAAGISTAGCARAVPSHPAIQPAGAPSNSPEQWAFGGTTSIAYSCLNSTCFGSNFSVPGNGSVNIRYHVYVDWVVIYTQTNLSANRTQIEVQAALNASGTFHMAMCIAPPTAAACTTTTLDLAVSGLTTAIGFTNLTAGTVTLTPSGSSTASSAPAIAVTDAQSNASTAFSGTYSASSSNATSSTTGGTIHFSVGNWESSAIRFAHPLGIVPNNPAPGDNWTSSSAYTAHGTEATGFNLSAFPFGTMSNWNQSAVSPSGTLTVNGTDLGTSTLWDNFTSPPISLSTQQIELQFSTGGFFSNYSATDGWAFIATGGSPGTPVLVRGAHSGPAGLAAVHPRAGLSLGGAGTETAYYRAGPGFVGAGLGASASAVPLAGGATASPSLYVRAGPEPVSVAEQQYQAIRGVTSAASPWWQNLWIWVVVTVVAGVVAGLLIWRRVGRRRRSSERSRVQTPVQSVSSAPHPPGTPPGPPANGPGFAPRP